MGIRPGQILEIVEEDGRVVMTKHIPEDAWSGVVGILNSESTTDEMIEEMRGPVAGVISAIDTNVLLDVFDDDPCSWSRMPRTRDGSFYPTYFGDLSVLDPSTT